jgi:alpha-beta hydrolase superfamily lysophospholipase
MKHSESKFEGHGKLQLLFQKWQPETETRAVFAIVHGFGEHSGRYTNVVNHLVPLGFTVYGFARCISGHQETTANLWKCRRMAEIF